MKKQFENKVVVITGASAGLGRAIARKFAKHGAKIGLIARGIDGLAAAKKEVEEMGSEAVIIPARSIARSARRTARSSSRSIAMSWSMQTRSSSSCAASPMIASQRSVAGSTSATSTRTG